MRGSPFLLIRANASVEIGTGHVMRCLALAQAWRRHGGDAHFLLAPGVTGLESRLQVAGCEVSHLAADWVLGGVEDTAATIDRAQELRADWVVVDGYHFDANYQLRLKEAGLRVLFVDDYGHCDHYHADLVLNQNIYAREALYANRNPDTELLLGCEYALLREEFRPWIGWQREVKPVAERLLVTLGGADPDNQTGKVLQALRLVETPLHVTVLVGAANKHRSQLEELVDSHCPQHEVELLVNAANMPELMAKADVAVCAGGSTNWELAFMGLPSLALIIADNQRELVAELATQGVVRNLGWYQSVPSEKITAILHEKLHAHSQRFTMCERAQTLVDGWGAERTVAKMMSRTNFDEQSELSLRSALPEDIKLYWNWANDPTVRASAFNPDPIPWEDHVTWFTNKIIDDRCRMWLLLAADVPIGQIRYDLRADKTAEIGFSIAVDGRGKGAGTTLLRYTCYLAIRALNAKKLLGLVLLENRASQRAFEKAGYYSSGKIYQEKGQSYMRFEWEVMKDDD
jgi:UDP-2,4-diacetamido-2,4,6-trideoxy-beta-L-altropyranose hydrolase